MKDFKCLIEIYENAAVAAIDTRKIGYITVKDGVLYSVKNVRFTKEFIMREYGITLCHGYLIGSPRGLLELMAKLEDA